MEDLMILLLLCELSYIVLRLYKVEVNTTMRILFPCPLLLIAGLVRAQTGITDPITEDCGPSVVCVNRYANVLP